MTSLSSEEIETTVVIATAEISAAEREQITLPQDLRSVMLAGIFAIMGFYTLYFCRSIFVPILMAVLLKLFFQPLIDFLAKLHVPKAISALLTILLLLGGVMLLGSVLAGPATQWVQKAPQGIERLQQRLLILKDPLDQLQNASRQIEKMAAAPSDALPVSIAGPGLSMLLASGTQLVVRSFGTTILLLFFLLLAGDTFRRRLVEILPRLSDKKRAVEITNEIENSISSYLITISVINAGVGIATGIAFYFCGLSDAVLWGALAFLLNFIPIVGPLCAAIIFLVAGIMSFDNWVAFLPLGIYLAIILIEGQAITPSVLMRRFSLNPVAIIVALIFWFWMWGTPGAFLAVPMLATFKIICDYIRPLKAIGHLLEG